jgi:hypothetical protein
VNRRVVPAVCPQVLDAGGRNPGRRRRQQNREVAERPDPRLEIGLPIVVGRVGRKLVWCALSTEVVGVGVNSVVAVVRARDDDGEKLALGAA